MTGKILATFYERDIHKLIEEIKLFKNEELLWETQGSVTNSCGNLALHIIGGLNYLIGTNLKQTGYLRKRDQEFSIKSVEKSELVSQLEQLVSLIHETVGTFTQEQMDAEYPILFDGSKNSNSYVLIQLSLHLNYHLGRVNYLRRILE